MTRPRRCSQGDRIGPYELLAPLGEGGFSEVWRARSDDGRVVALKVLVNDEHVRQLRAEADALLTVRGRGVLRVHEVALTNDPPYLALEVAEGGSLRARLGRGLGRGAGGLLEFRRGAPRHDAVAALEAVERLLEVLARVHAEGVVHGDLKPENVLYDAHDGVVLADFGLSRRISQRSASLSVSLSAEDARIAGTLDYMAPEQRAGERPTARSDVYACGVLLYELLTGERPQGAFQLPGGRDPAVPPAVDRLVACCLAHDPLHRFANAGAVLRHLRTSVTAEWRALAPAYRRATALLARGFVAQVREPATFFGSLAIVAGASTLAVLTSETARARGALPTLVGCAVGAALVYGAWRLLRPWLDARLAKLAALQDRLALQIRTGAGWEPGR